MRGSEFASRYAKLSPADREARVLELALDSDFVHWPFVPLKVGSGEYAGEIEVASDYFSIGEADDFIRMPISPLTAQRIADKFGWFLPTRKIVDLIWRQAQIRLPPETLTPDASMVTLPKFAEHSQRIQLRLANNYPEWRGKLIAGHKKDVVLTNKLVFGRVAIYGWHRSDGTPIQGLNATSHEDTYVDYSHGVRFAASTATINGSKMSLADVFASFSMCGLVSDEGILRVTQQPTRSNTVPVPVPGPPPTEAVAMEIIKKGSRNWAVKDWQAFLDRQGFRDQDGLKLGDDGDFGARTEFATKQFQAANGLTADGVVGPMTHAKAFELEKSPSEPTQPTINVSEIVIEDFLANVKFVQARNYTPANRTKIDVIVIHDMEFYERDGGARWCANFFAGPNAPKASAHFCIDRDEIVQCVLEKDVAWHAPGANHNGIGIEHAGFARQTPEEWRDEFSSAMLERSAELVADLCERYAIPIERPSVDALKNGARGIVGHKDCTDAFRGGKGHYDPGEGFPWIWYFDRVRAYMT